MPSVQLTSASSAHTDAEAVVDDLVQQFGEVSPKLVTLFAPRDRDHLALNRAMRRRLPNARLVGATSGAQIDRRGIHRGTVLAGALWGDFEVGIGLGTRLSVDAVAAGTEATTRACKDLGVRPADLGKRHVGMVIDDGFRYKKEEFLIGMLEPNPALVLVGGGAGDAELDPSKQSALVHADDEVVSDAVTMVLFQTEARWAAMRSHWYVPTGRTLTITKVDASSTRALEIDGQPAAKRYAELLGVGVDELEFGKPKGFATSPTALLVGREYFLRAPWKPLDDGSILFANLLEEGTELEIMRIGDIVKSTTDFFTTEIPARVGTPTAALLFHCSGRQWFADATGASESLSNAFTSAPPSVGMNCQFELYCGFHINTTLTALVFGST
ncbi:MAG: FIST C-terminal domain-containing protein [Deltaproteobacteria bacterium]|nr:FIST C-terminal domain-containing protein [Deltaproteobacteria bacterium]